tara:strand:+ start:2986 stop:3219 length:234 start_codon:yes stop_codon:yes gene_type:complete
MSRDDYLSAQEEMQESEHRQAQEEAHKHFVIQEFASIVLADGPASTLGQLPSDAQHEIKQLILHDYMQRLSAATEGL